MPIVTPDLPSGTITFLFSDVEGSTKLLNALGPERYAEVLAEHRRVMRDAFTARGGVEIGTEGDSFFVTFPSATEAVEAARTATEGLASGPIRVRMGLHTGTALVTGEGYVGRDIHLAARIAAVGHGGQVLVSSATAALVGLDGLRQLGEHRLKDFDEPVALYQLGDAQFPPLKTISNTNLPRPASSFVGREREVAEVAARLRDGARLLSLTGPGGTGKTRLAIEAASTLVTEFLAGVFWVDLAPLRDPGLVVETIGQVLGAKDGVAEHIGQREMLLLVDNLEQVVAAAPELATLVEACPNLRILVTSRERLRVRGEVEFPVAPLADPDAVALFCARAQVEADDTVRALCLALDNLPLALELAAARASVLSAAQILERLAGRLDLLKGGRDADPRQRTLRATIEWSHELLHAEDQRLFARLAVFRGGWTLDASEEVADADLDGLESLVDKSLVRHTADRFWMLETIREYAAEQLDASSEADAVRRRHADYYLAYAEQSAPGVRAEELSGGRERVDAFARELDNCRAALDLFESRDEGQLALRLAAALTALWANPVRANRDSVAEGQRRLQTALGLDASQTLARANALAATADVSSFTDDPEAVRAWAQEALEIYRAFGDDQGIAESLSLLGAAVGQGGDWRAAQPLLAESLQRFRNLGDAARTMWATRTLAWSYASLEERGHARPLYEDALAQARAAGNRLFESVCLGSLGSLALTEGRLADSHALTAESLRIQRDVGDPVEIGIGLCHAADLLAAMDHAPAAIQLLAAFDTLSEELGGSYPWVTRMNEATLERARAQVDEPTFASAWEEGVKLTIDGAVNLALNVLEAADRRSA